MTTEKQTNADGVKQMSRSGHGTDSLGNMTLRYFHPSFIGLCEAVVDNLVSGSAYAVKCAKNIEEMKASGEVTFLPPETEDQQEAIDAAIGFVAVALKLKTAQQELQVAQEKLNAARKEFDSAQTELLYKQNSAAGGNGYWYG